jgi:hypothetical protein
MVVALAFVLGLFSPWRPALDGAAQADSRYFPETGHWLRGAFLRYWDAHGGLAQQGYPLTEPFQEQSPLDGKTYVVQYFERAVFELHPENAGTPYEVLLAQLGKYELDRRYPNGSNPAAAPVAGNPPAPPPAPAPPAYGVGDTFDLDGLHITLHEARAIPGTPIFKPRPGYGFLMVMVTFENTSAVEVSVSSLILSAIKDSSGQEYGWHLGATAAADRGRAPDGVLRPGEKLRGPIGYEVPTNAAGLQWIYKAWVGAKRAVFAINP